MPEGQRDAWTERLLQLVLQDNTSTPLRAAAGAALGGVLFCRKYLDPVLID